MSSHLETSAATGVVALGVFQLASMWQNTAPSLADLRLAPASDWAAHQTLTDADILVGATALMAGGATAYLMRSWIPFVVMVAAFTALSLWYHSVCNSAHYPG